MTHYLNKQLGTGHRLGSPTPGIVSSATAAGAGAGAGAGAEKKSQGSAAESDTAAPRVDESQPVLTLQIRLGDGSRIVGRFNATHTVGDVYEFVAARSSSVLAPHGSQGRDWVLMTTFPSKKLEAKGLALGDLEGYKRGGVLVQKWE
ncbi:hypothetical protein KEM56_005768 [Ascosphaera pollenicola]|nr:hypothetical protein KEM56_005768 [Ascosphaera pollenicola]